MDTYHLSPTADPFFTKENPMAASRPFNDDTAYWGVSWEEGYGYPFMRCGGACVVRRL